jgi:hypothetical protein
MVAAGFSLAELRAVWKLMGDLLVSAVVSRGASYEIFTAPVRKQPQVGRRNQAPGSGILRTLEQAPEAAISLDRLRRQPCAGQ